MVSLITTNLNKIRTNVQTTLNTIKTIVQAGMTSINTTVRSGMQEMVRTIESNLKKLPGLFKQYLDACLSNVDSFKTDLVAKGKAAAEGFVKAIKDGLSSLPGDMETVGEEIVNGIWNGISGNWSWLESQVRAKAKSLLDAAKDELEVGSPSRAFRDELGRWLMPGTVEGMEDSMPDAISAVEEQMHTLVASMKGAVNAEAFNFGTRAGGLANAKALAGAGTVVYADNSLHQNNEYHVPVATPSETAKAQREALRNIVGGVK
jgi:phage-related protein